MDKVFIARKTIAGGGNSSITLANPGSEGQLHQLDVYRDSDCLPVCFHADLGHTPAVPVALTADSPAHVFSYQFTPRRTPKTDGSPEFEDLVRIFIPAGAGACTAVLSRWARP